MTITLAFYKGKGTWVDRLIRWSTRGVYSHVEFARYIALERETWAISASDRDGGLRGKYIAFKREQWDLVEVPWRDFDDAEMFFLTMTPARYDYFGIFFSQVFNLGRHSKTRWFCSEFCAAALGLTRPQAYSPQRLYEVVMDIKIAQQRLGAGEPRNK